MADTTEGTVADRLAIAVESWVAELTDDEFETLRRRTRLTPPEDDPADTDSTPATDPKARAAAAVRAETGAGPRRGPATSPEEAAARKDRAATALRNRRR